MRGKTVAIRLHARRAYCFSALSAAVIHILGTSPLLAQVPRPARDTEIRVSSTQASVAFRPLITLSTDSAVRISTVTQSVFEDSRGFVLAPVNGQSQLALYSVRGTRVGVVTPDSSRSGWIHRVIRVDDGKLEAFDGETVTRLTADGDFVDARLMLGFAAGSTLQTNRETWVPVLRPDGHARVVRFDSVGNLLSPIDCFSQELPNVGRAITTHDGRLFLLQIDDSLKGYRIAQLDAECHTQRLLHRVADWYLPPGYRPMSHDSPTIVPTTSLQSVHYQDGMLWILFHILKPAQEFGDQFDTLAEWERRYTFVLDVVDPTNGEMVFSSKYDQPPFYSDVAGSNHVFTWKQDARTRRLAVVVQSPSLFRVVQH